jgi:hypothetical protein
MQRVKHVCELLVLVVDILHLRAEIIYPLQIC